MDWLQQAVAAGYKDKTAHMKKTPTSTRLREREGLQEADRGAGEVVG